jgi:hypothetical protein
VVTVPAFVNDAQLPYKKVELRRGGNKRLVLVFTYKKVEPLYMGSDSQREGLNIGAKRPRLRNLTAAKSPVVVSCVSAWEFIHFYHIGYERRRDGRRFERPLYYQRTSGSCYSVWTRNESESRARPSSSITSEAGYLMLPRRGQRLRRPRDSQRYTMGGEDFDRRGVDFLVRTHKNSP